MKKRLLSLLASFALLGSTQLAHAQQGASLNFDGTNDHVDLGSTITSTFNNATKVSVEAWVYPTTTTGTGAIVGNHQGPTQFQLRRAGSNYDFFIGFGSFSVSSTATVTANTWQHVAGVFDGNNLYIYVDGTLSGTTSVTSFSLPVSSVPVKIGGDGFGEYFTGNIDEVRIWSGARSLGLIQQYMNCSVSDTANGLRAYYRFNDGMANGNNGSVTTLFDAGVNKYNGTLNNFTKSGSVSNFTTDYFNNYFSLQSTLTDANCNNTLGGAVAADFDGDGDRDLMMTDWNYLPRMYMNDGKGNFPLTYSAPVPSGNYEAGDVDNDGDIDLVVANNNTVSVYANNGSGTFAAITGNFFQGTGSASVTKMADLNGDGKKDLIVGNGGSGATDSSQVWVNTGTTGNASFAYSRGLTPNPSRNSIAVGDLNGDGFIDIVTGGGSWSAQVFHNNNNNGSFTQVASPPGYGGGVMLIDWNQDGKLDYMNYDAYNNYGLRYILNNGSGIFTATATILLQSAPSNHCRLADLNGDGFLDAVLSNWGGNALAYLSNGCALTLQSPCNYSLGRADNYVTLADYNGDGTTDIFCQARCNSSSVYMNYLTPVVGTPLPNVNITGSSIINYGSSTVLIANGATSYQWSANAGSATTSTVSVSPTVPTTYTVVGTNTVGCSSSATVLVSFNGAALNFNGTNNTVDLGMGITNALAGGSLVTAEAWVAPTTSVSTGATIVNNHQNTTQFLLGINGSAYYFFIGFGSFVVTTPPGVVTPGNWQHVAGVYDGNSLKIYVNGVLQATTAVSPAFIFPSSSTTTKLGSDAFGEYFDGNIDEVRVWNRALCEGELQNNMNGELKLPQTGLLGYYRLNQGVAGANNAGITTAADSSGNSNNGTLQNFALNGATSNWVAPGGVITGNFVTPYVVPTLTVSGTTTICEGQSTVLTANGANTYTWTSGPATASYTVNPTSTTSYSVMGNTSLGCPSNMAVQTVTVNPLPVITGQSGNVTACGDVSATFTLSSAGNNAYQWYFINTVSPFDGDTIDGSYTEVDFTTDSMTIQQLITGDYNGYAVYCVVTNSDNCSVTSAPDTITVNPVPAISASSNAICLGATYTFIPSGALTYSYNPAGPAVTPTITASYTISGTDNNGCVGSTVATVTVNPLPSVTASATSMTLCETDDDTLNASGAVNYQWDSNAGSATTASVVVTPTVNTTYVVTGTDANSCVNTATVSITVIDCSVGINGQVKSSWIVYPNPSNGNFTLQAEREIGLVEVYNALGALIYKTNAKDNKVQIDLGSEAAGIYYLHAQGRKVMISKQ